jgi:glycerol-3-phosphate acyltransferase PlsY
MPTFIGVLIVAYLLGSIPFGLLIGKAKGVDIRKYGSGNIGTSNVGRILGKKAAIATLLGDGLKGLIPVLLARWLLGDAAWWLVATGIAAIAGHNWPVWLKFKGGKGVTTTYGAFLGVAWLPALATILTWVVVTKITTKSSIAALISAPAAVLWTFLLGRSGPVMVFAGVTCVLIYIRHISNIQRILAGTETRLDDTIDVTQDENAAQGEDVTQDEPGSPPK